MKFIHLFIILSIILFVPVKSKTNTVTFDEQRTTIPRIYTIEYYDDNTIAVQIIRLNGSNSNNNLFCVEEYLSIRIIYPDGVVKPIDIPKDELKINSLNFCIHQTSDKLSNPIQIYAVRSNFLLVTYMEATDINNVYTYEDWAMVIDFNGKILSKTLLGPSLVDSITKEWEPFSSDIRLNVNREKGFLRIAPKTNATNMISQQFVINEDGTIQKLVEVELDFSTRNLRVEYIATMDGGYGIIYANSTEATNTTTTLQDPFSPKAGIYGIFLDYGKKTIRGPIVLYESQNPVNILTVDCEIAYVEIGQTCILTANSTSNNTYFIKVDFLSSGTVYNVQTIPVSGLGQYNIKSLPFGGYFLSVTAPTEDIFRLNIDGYITDNTGRFYPWELTHPAVTNFKGDFKILPNNSLVLPQPEVGQRWSLVITDLYKIEAERDHGYHNLRIDITSPTIDDYINIRFNESFTIRYHDPVELSDGNITIFQYDNGQLFARQNISKYSVGSEYENLLKLDEDGFTVRVKIIDSTFNKPNGTYYALIDDGFVISRTYKEPIPGIRRNVWKFKTHPVQQANVDDSSVIKKMVKKETGSIKGKVRLNLEGSVNFKNLNASSVHQFFADLEKDLAMAIPIAEKQINTGGRESVYDISLPRGSPKQIILPVNIEGDDAELVDLAVKDLDTLIKNKFVTALAVGKASRYLDIKYGYEPIPRWIDENWKYIIGTSIFMVLLFILFLLAERNTAVFKCGIAISDFVTGILFASVDSTSIDNIFISSVFFVIFPFIVNLGFAFNIMSNELIEVSEVSLCKMCKKEEVLLCQKCKKEESDDIERNSEDYYNRNNRRSRGESDDTVKNHKSFLDWAKDHQIILMLFTLLAGVDIENLKFLESDIKLLHLHINTKLSESANHKMLIGTSVNTVIEKFANVFIQSFYLSQSVFIGYNPILKISLTCISIILNCHDIYRHLYPKENVRNSKSLN